MPLANKLSINDVDIKGLDVIMRVDFNVVSAVTGKVDDENRIIGAIPTIKLALKNGAKRVVLISHCGRPDGRVMKKFSLKPVVEPLEKHLGMKVVFLEETIGDKVVDTIKKSPDGTVLLLENLRFHLEEEGKGLDADGNKAVASPEAVKKFREELSRLGDIVVNDAFGTAHRAHSSMVGINHKKVCGLLLKKELDYFAKIIEAPAKPFCAIMGGAKVGDKIPVMLSLIDQVQEIIVGGGMAFTFLKVLHNVEIGASLFDAEGAALIPQIMAKAKEKGVTIHLPVDFRAGDKFAADAAFKEGTIEEGVPAGWMGFDIGPKTEENYKKVIASSKTLIWNGPMGVFEFDQFSKGSIVVLNALVDATKNGAITVVGGGDSAALCGKFNKSADMSHVSTGGGASLELLEGKDLPGVTALTEKN